MESHESVPVPLPTPEEAEAALEVAERARSSAAEVEAPLWYSGALGLWVAPIGLITLAPSTLVGVVGMLVALVLWMALFGVIVRLGVNRIGVLHPFDRRQLMHMIRILVPVAVAAGLVGWAAGMSWMLPAFTAIEGVAIVLHGLWLRSRVGRTA
jgi:hypothetical protein